MNNHLLNDFFTHPLYSYDKEKVNLLKTILPILIIIHHISYLGFPGTELIGAYGDIVMYFFFAMSGYGLTISYLKNKQYINGFLQKSLRKLFVPYIFALILFGLYRYFKGIDQVALFKEKGLFLFVPTSWYIWILSYFYIFYYLVFKYIRSNIVVKVLMTCGLVMGYVIVAPHIGLEGYEYYRCPAFCIGMLFALFDYFIRPKCVRWQALVVLCLLLVATKLPVYYFNSLIYPSVLFVLMFLIKGIKETRIVKFISSISLEMFIIQFIPIYIIAKDLHITNTCIAVPLILLLDIMLAYIIHIIIIRLSKIF